MNRVNGRKDHKRREERRRRTEDSDVGAKKTIALEKAVDLGFYFKTRSERERRK